MDNVTTGQRFLTQDVWHDPYPVYARLRDTTPFFWDETLKGWIATRYEDVAAGLRDPRLSVTVRMEDVPFAGQTIPKEQRVFLVQGAANRDPAQFPDPDKLDVGRKEAHHHVSFGAGIHFCIGAPLARLEGQIALRSILKRFPKLRLATDKLEYNDNFTLRGLKSLPVAF